MIQTCQACQRCKCLITSEVCATCGWTQGNPYHSLVVDVASATIRSVMEGGQALYGDSWVQDDDSDDLAHITEHLRKFSTGDTSEPHLQHSLTRLGFMLARKKMSGFDI